MTFHTGWGWQRDSVLIILNQMLCGHLHLGILFLYTLKSRCFDPFVTFFFNVPIMGKSLAVCLARPCAMPITSKSKVYLVSQGEVNVSESIWPTRTMTQNLSDGIGAAISESESSRYLLFTMLLSLVWSWGHNRNTRICLFLIRLTVFQGKQMWLKPDTVKEQ